MYTGGGKQRAHLDLLCLPVLLMKTAPPLSPMFFTASCTLSSSFSTSLISSHDANLQRFCLFLAALLHSIMFVKIYVSLC